MKFILRRNIDLMRIVKVSLGQILIILIVSGAAYAKKGKNKPGLDKSAGFSDKDQPLEFLQTIRVSGTVKDEKGETLPGASVMVKGTQRGVSTNANGVFTIEVPSTSSVLVVTFTGYQSKEVTVGSSTNLDISLAPNLTQLNEVVVVGYGTQKRTEVTGASSSVSATEIAKRPLVRLEQALQGTTAGVAVTSQNGQPGQGLRVKIRGANSITGSNEPLYVIDGNIGNGSDVNPNDIESIEILKDAASTAIYGSRGSNGVVLITTKSGQSGKTQINFNTWVQKAEIPRKLDLMNAYDFARSVNNQFQLTGSVAPFSDAQLADFRANGGTDWQDALHTKPWVKNYQLDVSGGSEATRYRFSVNHLDQPGIILNQWYKRTTFRANVDTRINSRMNVKFILDARLPKSHNNQYGGGLTDPFNQAVEWDPTSPIRDANGNYISNSPYASIQFNPIAQASSQAVDNTGTNISGTGTLTYRIFDDLVFTSTNVYNTGSQFGQTLQGPGTGAFNNRTDFAQITSSRSKSYLSSNYLTYKKTFGDHSLTATALYELNAFNNTSVQALSRNLSSYSLGYYNLGLGATQQTSSGYTEDALVSYMGRINYAYKDKYFLTAAIRTDGSSHLTDKWSSFPSLGVRWNLAKEDFLTDSKVFSELSLRASYGQSGNQAVGAFATIPQITIRGGQPNYYFNGTTPSVATGLGTPVTSTLRWEVKTSYDFGLDAAFLNNRLSFTFDAYHNRINDLLYNRPVPGFLGGGNYLANVGSVENKGLEFALGGTPISNSNFKWTTNLTVSLNRNKVISLGGSDNLITGGVTGQSILRVGRPLGEFYGFKFLGTWKTAEAAEAATYSMKPGDAKYEDVNGDRAYTSADYQPIGNATPRYTFGLINDLAYKNFTLSFMFQGSQGNDIFSQTLAFLWGGLGDMKNATTAEALPEKLWTPQNETDIPTWSNSGKNYNLSSRYVYDASYVKLKNLSLAYRLPTSLVNSVKARSLEIYASTQNLFMITNFKGYDPEVENGSNAILQGQEFGVIPNPRTYTFGLRLGL